MKRVLTIGRDYSSDIHINDNTDIVSRNHAVIEVGRFGKYYITDQSRNGTYVNGIRIPSQQKYELRRGDEVSLAHTALLDWGQVPADNTLLYVIVSVVAVVVAIAAVVAGVLFFGGKDASSSTDVEWISGDKEALDTNRDGKNIVNEGDNDDKDNGGEASSEKDKEKKSKPATKTPKSKSKSTPKTEPKKAEDKAVDAIY